MADFPRKHISRAATDILYDTITFDKVQGDYNKKIQMSHAQEISDHFTANHERAYTGNDPDEAIRVTYRKN
jgi:hypothetical protein